MSRRAGLGHKAHETRVGPQRVEAGGSQPEPQRRAARPRPASGGTPPVAATWEWPRNTAGAFAAMSPGQWRYTVRPATQGRPWDAAIWRALSNWTARSDHKSMPISKRQLDQLVGAGVIDEATATRIADDALLRRRAAEPASLA